MNSSEKAKKLEEWNGTNTFHINRNKKTRSSLQAVSCLRTEEEETLGAMEEEEVSASEEDTDSSLCTIKRNEKTKHKGKAGTLNPKLFILMVGLFLFFFFELSSSVILIRELVF